VKAYAAMIGLDATAYGAHSLRSGFLTSAARKGASIFKMRDVAVTSPWTSCNPMSAMPTCSGITRELACSDGRYSTQERPDL
jgi:hypothetical protein